MKLSVPYIVYFKNVFHYILFFSSAESYFDVALAEAEFDIEFDFKVWPICLPKFSSSDLNLR